MRFIRDRLWQKMDFKKVSEYVSTDYYRLPRQNRNKSTLRSLPIQNLFPVNFPQRKRLWPINGSMKSSAASAEEPCAKNPLVFGKFKLYLCLALCPEHGFVREKIRIKKRIRQYLCYPHHQNRRCIRSKSYRRKTRRIPKNAGQKKK